MMRVDLILPASFLTLPPCLPRCDGLHTSGIVIQDNISSLLLLLSGYFIMEKKLTQCVLSATVCASQRTSHGLWNICSRCVTFVYAVGHLFIDAKMCCILLCCVVYLCEAVLLYLSKTHDCSNKRLNGQ